MTPLLDDQGYVRRIGARGRKEHRANAKFEQEYAERLCPGIVSIDGPGSAMKLLYLDNNASTSPDPLVIDAVARAMRDLPANPASHHEAGRMAADAIELSREQVAALVGARRQDVVFVSGATEANNLAVRGVFGAERMGANRRHRILVGATEHPAVLEVAADLVSRGAAVEVIPVDRRGLLDLDALSSMLAPDVLLVSVMAANNETGVVSPVEQASALAHEVGSLFHCDATQAMGRLSVDVSAMGIDLLSMSGHKMHGPKGVGALVVRRQAQLEPQALGGGHERGLRSGTPNTPGIVGLGVASSLAMSRMDEARGIGDLRDRFVELLCAGIDRLEVNGDPELRLCNTANVRFVGADAEAVMAGMPQVACSSGSACSSATPTPSPVLRAMGLGGAAASESLRFSLSRSTTSSEIELAAGLVAESVSYVRLMTAAEVV